MPEERSTGELAYADQGQSIQAFPRGQDSGDGEPDVDVTLRPLEVDSDIPSRPIKSLLDTSPDQ